MAIKEGHQTEGAPPEGGAEPLPTQAGQGVSPGAHRHILVFCSVARCSRGDGRGYTRQPSEHSSGRTRVVNEFAGTN